MKRLFGMLFVCMLVCVTSAEPYVGYIYPAGIERGTTNRFLVGGQGTWGNLRGAYLSGKGVKVLDLEPVPNFPNVPSDQQKYLLKWIAGCEAGITNAPPLTNDPYLVSWHSNKWYQAIHTLDALERELIVQFLTMRRNALQMSPALRQLHIVTIAADGDAPLGMRDFGIWSESGFSSPRPFEISAARHQAEYRYKPKKEKQKLGLPVVDAFPVILDGQIMPGETDRFALVLEKGRRLRCVVKGRVLEPYIGDAVPGYFNPVIRLLGRDGREVAFADDHLFHPDPILEYEIPENGTYTLEIRDNLFRGREDFVYLAELSYRTQQDTAAQTLPPKTHHVEPGAENRHTIHVTEPGEWTFALEARAAGSPLDAVLSLYDNDDQLLVRHDDVTNSLFIGIVPQAECDPVFTYTFTNAGTYAISVRDATNRGGPNWTYRLKAGPSKPETRIYAAKSAFALRPQSRVTIPLHIERRGQPGRAYLLENEYFRFENAVIPVTAQTWRVSAFCKLKAECAPFDFEIRAAVENGPGFDAVTVGPADEYEQAFAWKHLVPAHTFRAKVLPPWKPKPKPKAAKKK